MPRTTLLLVVIIVSAAIFSIGAYSYSNVVAGNIQNSSNDSIQRDTQIQASDMTKIISNKLAVISSSLELIAGSPSIQSQNASHVTALLIRAQNLTASYTEGYSWIDRHGTPLASSNATLVELSQSSNLNATTRPYFIGAEETGNLFVTGLINSTFQHTPIVVFAQPIYSPSHDFQGVATATVELSALGSLIRGELAPQFQSNFGMLDSNGTILYGSNPQNIGLNVFSATVQSQIPSGLRPQFDAFLTASLQGDAGVKVLSYQGQSGTVAYQPLLIMTGPGNQTKAEFFGTVYISAADTLAADQVQQIHQLQIFTGLVLLGIDATAVGAVVTIVRWNRGLDKIVKERTADIQHMSNELVKANSDLLARDETQKDFINIAVHELRTPVQPLVTLAEIINDSPRNDGKVEISEFEIGMLNRSVERLRRLTSTLLDVSRIENGSIQISKEPFDLNLEVRSAIAASLESVGRLVQTSSESLVLVEAGRNESRDGPLSRSQEKRLKEPVSEVRFTPAEGQLIVNADKTRVFEVLTNLLRNALAFSNGKAVEVSTSRQERDALVTIRDHGPGIDPEIMPKLFTKFATKSATGLGLGLYLSKNLIEAQGGKIWAENMGGVDRGASFSFTLPLDDPAQHGRTD